MARMKIKGLDEYASKLQKLSGGEAEKIMRHAVYEGAGYLADQIRLSIQSLPTFEGSWKNYRKPIVGVSDVQKQGLLNGLGTSKIVNDSGFVNVRIGFNGYNDHVTKHYPKGQPNALVARSVESGSSIGTKTPFIRPCVNANKNTIVTILAEETDNGIKKVMNN